MRACASKLGYAGLAEEVGVPTTTLWRFCNDGYEPKKDRIRHALGLPVEARILSEPRQCDCGCGEWFYPKVPHQKRLPGHARRRTIRA